MDRIMKKDEEMSIYKLFPSPSPGFLWTGKGGGGNMSWSRILLVSSSPHLASAPSLTTSILKDKEPTQPPPRPSYHYWRAVLPALLSLALTTTASPPPTIAIPSLNSPSSLLPLPTTPFTQSKSLPLGLLDGKIMPCPSTNPGCISSNPKSSSFAFPWSIPESFLHQDPVQKLEAAILKTQKNPRIVSLEDTPYGVYLLAEVDGGFGKDVLEFLVKGDVVGYRSMATKVMYVYPFTTALGDSKGQEERLKKIIDQLGWFAPSFDSVD